MSVLRLVAALLSAEGGGREFSRLGVQPEWLAGEERELFDFVAEFVRRHGSVPSRAAIRKRFPEAVVPQRAADPPSYYAERLRERWVHREARQACLDAQDLLNGDKPMEAMGLLRDVAVRTLVKSEAGRIVDYSTEGLELLTADWRQRAAEGDSYGIKLGWPTLDNMTGGLVPGDMLSIVGRPARGKSFLLLHAGLRAWRAGKVPMFVSMEMKPLSLVQRLAAMDNQIALAKLRLHELSSKTEQKLRANMLRHSETGLPFWVVDGSLTATVPDIVMYAQQLRPDFVLIDGAYLIKPALGSRGSKWEVTSGTAELIKAEIVEGLGLPAVVSYQFNRQSAKDAKRKRAGGQPGLEDIAYSDAPAQLSSVVLGMLQEESIETERERRVSILKGRNGEQGEFSIRWDFERYPFCDFREVETSVATLEYGGKAVAMAKK